MNRKYRYCRIHVVIIRKCIVAALNQLTLIYTTLHSFTFGIRESFRILCPMRYFHSLCVRGNHGDHTSVENTGSGHGDQLLPAADRVPDAFCPLSCQSHPGRQILRCCLEGGCLY